MLQIRVRTVTDDGSITASSRVLETTNVTYTAPFSASATLEFSVSRADFVPTQMPFLVAVEYAVNGGEFQRVPTEDLFIVEQDADDSKDLGQIVTYQAQAFVPWLLAGAYVGTGPFEKDGERTIDFDGQGRASSGHIMKYFIDESKSRGWLPALDYTFAVNTDSTGTNWNMDARAGISWRLETFYTQVLDQLTTQSFCDWSTSGNQLNMYNPGTLGVDRTEEVVLGGQDFERVPVKTDMTGWFTHVIALSDAGRVHVQNTAAEARFGRRSVAMTQSGVKDVASSTKLANELLADGLQTKREESYRWTPEANHVVPWKDFNNGDMVTAMSRGGALPRRVIGIMITQGAGVIAEVEVKVGEKISSLAARNRKKIESVAVGGIAGGSGDAFPSNPGPSPLKPEKPVGLRITSNTGEWSSDGATALSNVGLEWDAVTQDIDGGEITVPEYEVWSRLPSATASFDTATNTNSVEVNSYRPGEERLVSVRARSQAGVWSEWSNELSVTPTVPSSIVPAAPAKPVLVSNIGAFTATGAVATVTLTIPEVTLSTDGEPIEVAEYELWDADGPLFRLPASPAKVTIPSDIVRSYRARAGTAQGFWGDLSLPLEVTGAKPAVAVRNPTTPVLTTGAGNAFARWDGTYVSGGTNGAHRVDVEARIGAGAWVVQGTLIGAGQQIIKLGEIGDTVAVRLRAYDQLGRLTGTSAESSIEIVGIPRADLDQDINDFLDGLDDLAGNAWDAASAAVKNMVTQYAVGSSDTVAPSSGWSATSPVRTPGSFIWMRSVITFGNDSTSTTSPVLVTGNDGADGNPGAPGAPGVGITGTVVNYAVGSSGTTAPSSGWGTSIPSVGAGQYLWTRTVTSYSSGSPTTAYSVGQMGQNGAAGAPGKGVSSTEVRYQLHSNGTTAPTGTWQTSPQTQTEALPYLWTRTVTTYTDSTTSTSYSVGVRGAKGSDGATGAQGISVTSVQQYYQTTAASASAPAVPTTSTPPSPWTTTEPAYVADTALWATTRVGYSNSTFSYTPVTKVSAFTAAVMAGGKLTLATSNPTTAQGTGKPAGSLWMVKSGTAFVSMWEWTGSAWQSRPLSETIIPQIAIGAGTYGELSGTRLSARSITARELAIGDFSNMALDPLMEISVAGHAWVPVNMSWGTQTGAQRSTKSWRNAGAGDWSLTSADYIPVQPGASFYLESEIYRTSAGTVHLGVQWYTDTFAAIGDRVDVYSGTPSNWSVRGGAVEAPANAAYAKIVYSGTGATASGNAHVTGTMMRRMYSGELIVDGSILARHVEMDTAFADKFWANEGNFGKINTAMITSDFGSQLNILSNEGITFIAGELATQSAAIDDLDLLANDALTTAQAVETDVATALATAETANGAALLAKASADGANDRITEHQSVFKITPTGAVISTVNAEQELRLNPSSIELAQNGIAISRWEAGRFIVNETLMNKAQIAEHSFEAYNTKRTIIRPI